MRGVITKPDNLYARLPGRFGYPVQYLVMVLGFHVFIKKTENITVFQDRSGFQVINHIMLLVQDPPNNLRTALVN
jgi:hypothetical protein